MGSLINTVGTRLLIEHFNTEFRGTRLDDIRNDPPTSIPVGPPIQEYFNTNPDLMWLTNNMTHAHASTSPGNRCFLPPKHSDAGSPQAINRWIWFIGNPAAAGGLAAARQVDICNAIYYGLTQNSSLGTLFDRIEFDAVDSAPGGTQSVLAAEEWDRNGVRYYKIVLVTPPIPQTAGGGRPKLDPQPGDP
jgi:hypothetical protein